MKNIFYILLLLPTIIFAQYPSNSGQKITLGEQTTADGLVYRGRLADTANLLTNKLDTSVYIVLDTGTRAMWYYRASTTPKWTRLVDSLNNMQGQLSLTTKVTGVLPVANGGTGQTTAGIITGSGTNNFLPIYTGLSTLSNSPISVIDGVVNLAGNFNVGTLGNLSINAGSAATPLLKQTANYNEIYTRGGSVGIYLGNITDASNYYDNNNHYFRTLSGGFTRMTITSTGNVGIGTASPTARLHVKGVDVTADNFALKVDDSNNLNLLSVKNNGDVTLKNPLSVANGGTNTSTLTANKVMVGNGTSGVITPINLHWDNTNRRLGIGITSPETPLEVLRGNSSWVYFRDTITKGYFSIINGSTGSNITSPLFYLQGAGFFGSNQQSTAGFFAFKDSLSSENENDIVWEFDASKRKPTVTSLASAVAVTSGKTFLFSNRRTAQLSIMANGDVNIGSSLPTERLDVNGNARIRSVGSGAYGNILNITSDGTLTTATSDEKYKYNILPISYGLNTILQLNPVNFQWIKGEENDLGFIAQDVAEIIPEAVNTNWNSDLLMRYESIIPILTKAIQEQNTLIKALEQRILILENK